MTIRHNLLQSGRVTFGDTTYEVGAGGALTPDPAALLAAGKIGPQVLAKMIAHPNYSDDGTVAGPAVAPAEPAPPAPAEAQAPEPDGTHEPAKTDEAPKVDTADRAALDALGWNELRAEAKRLDVPSHGRSRDEITDAILAVKA